MSAKLSSHLQSMVEESPHDEWLKDLIPRIVALENRNERLENKHRVLRLRYNVLAKTVSTIQMLVGKDMLDPHKPENYE